MKITVVITGKYGMVTREFRYRGATLTVAIDHRIKLEASDNEVKAYD